MPYKNITHVCNDRSHRFLGLFLKTYVTFYSAYMCVIWFQRLCYFDVTWHDIMYLWQNSISFSALFSAVINNLVFYMDHFWVEVERGFFFIFLQKIITNYVLDGKIIIIIIIQCYIFLCLHIYPYEYFNH